METVARQASVPRWARIVQGFATVLLVVYLIWTLPGVRPEPGFDDLFDGVLQGSGYVIVAGLCIGAAIVRRSSITWWLVAAAVGLRAVGFVLALSFIGAGDPLPYPSVADGAWVLSSIALFAAVVLRIRELAPRLTLPVVLDGVAAALLLLGIAIAVLADPIVTLSAPGTPRAAIVVNVGYPVLDMLLLVVAAALATTERPRLARADAVLIGGIASFVIVDVVYFVLLAEGEWRPGTMLASFSLIATAVIATAVWWAPPRPSVVGERRIGELPVPDVTGVAVPAAFAAVAISGLAVLGAIDASPYSLIVYGLAGAAAVVRGLLTVQSDRREAGRALGAAGDDLRRFQVMVEASHDFIGIADPSGAIVYINPNGKRMLGMKPGDDVDGLTVAGVSPGGGTRAFAQRWPRLLERGSWTGESELVPVDGSPPIPVAVSTFVIADSVGRGPYAIATIQRDIGDRLRADAALRDLAAEREQVLTRLVQAQEDERARIAADVHDDSVQALAAVDLRIAALRKRLSDRAPDLADSIDIVQETVTAATARLRALLFDLETPSRETGLASALAETAEFVFAGSDVRWRLTGDTDLDLTEAELVTAYRVAKEAMVNIRKHADAHLVTVDLRRDGTQGSVITVRDDGRGIAPGDDRDRPGHRGLMTMRDRARLSDGRLDIGPADGGGTQVRLAFGRSAGPGPAREGGAGPGSAEGEVDSAAG